MSTLKRAMPALVSGQLKLQACWSLTGLPLNTCFPANLLQPLIFWGAPVGRAGPDSAEELLAGPVSAQFPCNYQETSPGQRRWRRLPTLPSGQPVCRAAGLQRRYTSRLMARQLRPGRRLQGFSRNNPLVKYLDVLLYCGVLQDVVTSDLPLPGTLPPAHSTLLFTKINSTKFTNQPDKPTSAFYLDASVEVGAGGW